MLPARGLADCEAYGVGVSTAGGYAGARSSVSLRENLDDTLLSNDIVAGSSFVPESACGADPILLAGSSEATGSAVMQNPYGTASDTIPFSAGSSGEGSFDAQLGSLSGRTTAQVTIDPLSYTAVGPEPEQTTVVENPYLADGDALLEGYSFDRFTFLVPSLPIGEPIQASVVLHHSATVMSTVGDAMSRAELALESVLHPGAQSFVPYPPPNDFYLWELSQNGQVLQDDPDSIEVTLDLQNGDVVQIFQGLRVSARAGGDWITGGSESAANGQAVSLGFLRLTPGLTISSASGVAYPVPEPGGSAGFLALGAALAALARDSARRHPPRP